MGTYGYDHRDDIPAALQPAAAPRTDPPPRTGAAPSSEPRGVREAVKAEGAQAARAGTTGAPVAGTETVIEHLYARSAVFGPPPDTSLSINLLEYSQEFERLPWTTFNGATVARNTAMAPDGTLTADTLTGTSNNSLAQSGGFTPLTTGVHTSSVYIRALTNPGDQVVFGIRDLTTGLSVSFYGAVWTGTAITAINNQGGGTSTYTFTDERNGWWRVSGQTPSPISAGTTYVFEIHTASGSAFPHSIYVWGAQVNAGALLPYNETLAIATTLSVLGKSALSETSITGLILTSFPGAAVLGTDLLGNVIPVTITIPPLNPKTSGFVYPFSGNFISGTGTAGSDNTADVVKELIVPANVCTQVGDRLRIRVVWAGTTGGAITGSLVFGNYGASTLSAVTDGGGAALQVNEVWVEYIDSTHANVIEGNGVPGAASAMNQTGFSWANTQYAQLRQNAVIDNHIVVYSITIDFYPKGV